MRLDNPFVEDKMAEIYNRYSRRYHNYCKALEELTKITSQKSKILEIGVGTGLFTELLLARGYDVRGIDMSEEMLKRASEQIRFLSEKCDLLDYEPSQRFDLVVSHSGGFTFKRGRFETYYQNKDRSSHRRN